MRIFVALTLLFSSALWGENSITWEKDFGKGVEASVREKKPLLLFFTGSDCSGWGMKLKNEILSSADFVEKTKGKFVFVEIDFPEHKAVDPLLASQNQALKEKWRVTEIPRLILVDAEGIEIARFGSTCSGGKEFGEDLLTVLEKDQNLKTSLKQLSSCSPERLEELYKLARELERETEVALILNAGVSKEVSFFLLEKYRLLAESGKSQENESLNLREKLLKSDPANQKKIPFSIALIDFQRLSNEKLLNPFIAIRPLEEYLQHFGRCDLENKWRLEMMIAQFYVDCDEWKTALIHAQAAFESAPETRKEEIARSLEYIRGETAIADSND